MDIWKASSQHWNCPKQTEEPDSREVLLMASLKIRVEGPNLQSLTPLEAFHCGVTTARLPEELLRDHERSISQERRVQWMLLLHCRPAHLKNAHLPLKNRIIGLKSLLTLNLILITINFPTTLTWIDHLHSYHTHSWFLCTAHVRCTLHSSVHNWVHCTAYVRYTYHLCTFHTGVCIQWLLISLLLVHVKDISLTYVSTVHTTMSAEVYGSWSNASYNDNNRFI